jgi:hypothetical protein
MRTSSNRTYSINYMILKSMSNQLTPAERLVNDGSGRLYLDLDGERQGIIALAGAGWAGSQHPRCPSHVQCGAPLHMMYG